MLKGIPAVIRAAWHGTGPAAKLAAAVKVNTSASRVGKDAVENDADAEPVGRLAQGGEICRRAEHRVRLAVVAGVVPVVGIGFKNRI